MLAPANFASAPPAMNQVGGVPALQQREAHSAGEDRFGTGNGPIVGQPPFAGEASAPTKTRLCIDFFAGNCGRGTMCKFAHGTHEIARRPPTATSASATWTSKPGTKGHAWQAAPRRAPGGQRFRHEPHRWKRSGAVDPARLAAERRAMEARLKLMEMQSAVVPNIGERSPGAGSSNDPHDMLPEPAASPLSPSACPTGALPASGFAGFANKNSSSEWSPAQDRLAEPRAQWACGLTATRRASEAHMAVRPAAPPLPGAGSPDKAQATMAMMARFMQLQSMSSVGPTEATPASSAASAIMSADSWTSVQDEPSEPSIPCELIIQRTFLTLVPASPGSCIRRAASAPPKAPLRSSPRTPPPQ